MAGFTVQVRVFAAELVGVAESDTRSAIDHLSPGQHRDRRGASGTSRQIRQVTAIKVG